MTNVIFENPLNIDRATQLKDMLKSALRGELRTHLEGESAKILFIDGRTLRFASPKDTLTILMNAQPDAIKSEMDVSEQPFFDEYVGIKRLMQGSNAAYAPIKDENGFDIAYYDHRHHDLYVPFDVFDLPSDEDAANLFARVMRLAFTHIQNQKSQQYLWGGTNADAVREDLQRLARAADDDTPERLERKLRDYQQEEEDARKRLRIYINKIQKVMRDLASAREHGSTLDVKIARDFDALLSHTDVARIEIRSGKIIVHTHSIIGTTDKGERKRFGKFRIEHTLGNTGVYFFGDTPKQGFWSGRDPHPHVSGDSGNPCLGNAGEAIAQMSSQHEYMALFSIAIEFLKAANTEDSAGAYARNWETVKEGEA